MDSASLFRSTAAVRWCVPGGGLATWLLHGEAGFDALATCLTATKEAASARKRYDEDEDEDGASDNDACLARAAAALLVAPALRVAIVSELDGKTMSSTSYSFALRAPSSATAVAWQSPLERAQRAEAWVACTRGGSADASSAAAHLKLAPPLDIADAVCNVVAAALRRGVRADGVTHDASRGTAAVAMALAALPSLPAGCAVDECVDDAACLRGWRALHAWTMPALAARARVRAAGNDEIAAAAAAWPRAERFEVYARLKGAVVAAAARLRLQPAATGVGVPALVSALQALPPGDLDSGEAAAAAALLAGHTDLYGEDDDDGGVGSIGGSHGDAEESLESFARLAAGSAGGTDADTAPREAAARAAEQLRRALSMLGSIADSGVDSGVDGAGGVVSVSPGSPADADDGPSRAFPSRPHAANQPSGASAAASLALLLSHQTQSAAAALAAKHPGRGVAGAGASAAHAGAATTGGGSCCAQHAHDSDAGGEREEG